jgi:hypothetical protein
MLHFAQRRTVVSKLFFEALWSDGSSCKHSSGMVRLGFKGQELRNSWVPAPQFKSGGELQDPGRTITPARLTMVHFNRHEVAANWQGSIACSTTLADETLLDACAVSLQSRTKTLTSIRTDQPDGMYISVYDILGPLTAKPSISDRCI